MKAVTGGWNSFWISETSSDGVPSSTNAEDGAQIKVLNPFGFYTGYDGGVIVNLPRAQGYASGC